MIRINLLKPAHASPRTENAFLSRREAVAGALLLAVGAGLLFYLLSDRKPVVAPARARAAEQSRAEPVPTPSLTPAPSPPPGGFEVSEVSLREEPEGLTVGVRAQPGLRYEATKLESPNRIVIDLPNCRSTLPHEDYLRPVNHPPVKRVRLSQFQLDPPVFRIVVDVTTFPRYEIQPVAQGLEIRLAYGVQ